MSISKPLSTIIDRADVEKDAEHTSTESGEDQPSSSRPVIRKRSVPVHGRKTSVSLEEDFWEGIKHIAQARGILVQELVSSIAKDRDVENLSSAIRLFVLRYYRDGGTARS